MSAQDDRVGIIVGQIGDFSKRSILVGEPEKKVQELFLDLVRLTGGKEEALSCCKGSGVLTPHITNIVINTSAAA
jgi:hypothetical protein